MRTKNHPPSKRQVEFREWLRSTGCCLGYPGVDIEIHHPIGSAARHRTAGNVGNWFMLPVSTEGHRIIERSSLEVQRALFVDLLDRHLRTFYETPKGLTIETLIGILTWSKIGLHATPERRLPF